MSTDQRRTRRHHRPAGRIALGLAAVGLLLAIVLPLGAGSPARAPAVGAQALAVPMLPSDPLVGPARGSAATVLSFARHYGAGALTDLDRYLKEVYRLAPLVGLDPGIVVAQSALETDTWRTAYWIDHRNPAGIGITHDGAPSFTWANGTDAARGHIVHLYLYAVGEIPSGHILAPYKALDPRYEAAAKAGYAGIAETIADLATRWASDRWYADKIAGRGNDLFLRYRIAAVGGSTGSTDGWLADDADGATVWETTSSSPPSAAYVWFDLGTKKPLGTIRWLFDKLGYADHLRVQVSNDRSSWITLGTFGNPGERAWQALTTTHSARYVRFYFTNPNRDAKLGSLAEVQFWPPVGSALPWQASTPAATVTPTPRATTASPVPPTATPAIPPTSTPTGPLTGLPITLVGSGGSTGATWTGRVRDGNLATDWHTTISPAPASAYVYVDLGGPRDLTGLRWVFNQTGAADAVQIQLSLDKRTWTTVAHVGNAPALTWQERRVAGQARYVRFLFANPNGDPVLGYLAEIEVWGNDVYAVAALESPTAMVTATATSTPVATATSTETPLPTPTEAPSAAPTDAASPTPEPPTPVPPEASPDEPPTEEPG